MRTVFVKLAIVTLLSSLMTLHAGEANAGTIIRIAIEGPPSNLDDVKITLINSSGLPAPSYSFLLTNDGVEIESPYLVNGQWVVVVFDQTTQRVINGTPLPFDVTKDNKRYTNARIYRQATSQLLEWQWGQTTWGTTYGKEAEKK